MNKNEILKTASGESAEDETVISKSQLKREAHELLDLGKLLIAMPDARLKRMPLDEDLRREIDFARNIRSNGARKRQVMTVGKMLRLRDVEELLDAVNDIQDKDRKMNARHHHIEAWRDALIDGSDSNLTYLLEKVPAINAQTLRQLIRNARKEVKLNKPPAASRKVFKLLRETDAQERLPALP